MICRIVVVDPEPPEPSNDILVYQVPENSRAFKLFTGLLDNAGIEYAVLEGSRRKRRK